MTGRLTTHVLDTARGCPAAGIAVEVWGEALLASAVTNADGRCDAPLLAGDRFAVGRYRLVFRVGVYFANWTADEPAFLDEIVVCFGVSDPRRHYHVPLLVSPYGYSVYRGS